MYSTVALEMTSGGLTNQVLWVHQSRRRRYRAKAKPDPAHGKQHHLSQLERSREYQRLLARLVALSERFQRSLNAEQRRAWLTLEDALLDHAWFLHGHYFRVGYQLGKAAKARRSSGDRPPSVTEELDEQAALLTALSKLLERLTDAGR